MLSEIYNTGKPEGFEQIDVKNIVLKYIPIGSNKEQVAATLKKLGCKDIIEEDNNKIFARYNWGQPLFDRDPRSAAMIFTFSADNQLIDIEAVYHKAQ